MKKVKDNTGRHDGTAHVASFYAEVERMATMTNEEVESALRQIGVEPVKALPTQLRPLVDKSRRRMPDTESAAANKKMSLVPRRTPHRFAPASARSISHADDPTGSDVMPSSPIALGAMQVRAGVIVLAQRKVWEVGRYRAQDDETIPEWITFLAGVLLTVLLPQLVFFVVTGSTVFVLMSITAVVGVALGFLMYMRTSSSLPRCVSIHHIPDAPSGPSTRMRKVA